MVRPEASATAAVEDQTDAPERISPEEYAQFIGQIFLHSIWLQDATVLNRHGPHTPEQATLDFQADADWENRQGGFQITHRYRVHVEYADEIFAEIGVSFCLDFDSDAPMTAEIFEIYEDVNLSINTWPFLREFVHSAMGRMGWVPFTLPALKRGVRQPERTVRKKPASRSRASRRKQ